MKKEVINKKGKELIDYLRNRPYREEFEEILRKKLSTGVAWDLVDFLATTDFMVVKKVPVSI